jgi:hypothetical protein
MDNVWNVIGTNLPTIITLLVGITVIWAYATKLLVVVKEIQELATAIIVAFADQKVTKEEIDAIVKEAKDVPAAIKELLDKKPK